MTENNLEILDRYTGGGLNGTLVPGSRPALLVVDLQMGFTDPAGGPGFSMPDVVATSKMLVAAAHAFGAPVFFTTIAFPADRTSVWLEKMPAMSSLRLGSGWEAIDPTLEMAAGDVVVTKQAASAFLGTELATRLRQLRVDTLVVCGATTSGCVRASVVDAISLGLRPFVVESAVGDREQAPHRAALLDIQAKYGEVVSCEDGIGLLKGDLS